MGSLTGADFLVEIAVWLTAGVLSRRFFAVSTLSDTRIIAECVTAAVQPGYPLLDGHPNADYQRARRTAVGFSMDRDEFIETQAAFQFGLCDAIPGLDLPEFAHSRSVQRPPFVFHNPIDRSFVPEERGRWFEQTSNGEWRLRASGQGLSKLDKHRASRTAEILKDIYALGMRSPSMIDMGDCVRTATAFPVFQYNRLRDATNAILWPLKRLHAIGYKDFFSTPDPSERTLRQKKPVLCWRGALRGHSTFGGSLTNIGNVIRLFVRGEIDKNALLSRLNTVPRYAFLSRYFGADGFDVGLSLTKSLSFFAEVPEIARYVKPRASPAEQLQCKYQISIRGTDVASSLAWQLASNSVVFREPYPWVVFFDCHFRPWEHYIPIAADFSDVPEKIAWCEANYSACQEMVDRRHELVRLLIDPEIRREALGRVVARYNDFYARWAIS